MALETEELDPQVSPSRSRRAVLIGAVSGGAIVWVGSSFLNGPADETANSSAAQLLADFHADLIPRYPGTEHLSAEALSALPADQVLLFDVREAEEFEVSHLSGATRVSPRLRARQFMALYGADLAGKTIVLYCSVGERSSNLAQALSEVNPDVKIVNLEGGIFNWHNQRRPVFAGAIQTDQVHPFNAHWGRLLDE